MKKTLLIIVICCALAASRVLLISNKKETPSVTTVNAEIRHLKKVIELSGQVSSSDIYIVSSVTGGKVDDILAEEGDMVNHHETVIKLNADQLNIELKKANLELSQIDIMTDNPSVYTGTDRATPEDLQSAEQRAKLALALSQSVGLDMDSFNAAFSDDLKEKYADYQTALTSGLCGQTLEDYENSNFENSVNNQATADIAKLAVSSLKDSIDAMNLKSEIDGEVISVSTTKGAFLAPGMPAMTIAKTDSLIIEAVAFEKDMTDLEENMAVNIFLNDGSDFYYEGHISKIGNLTASVSDYQTMNVMAKVMITPDSTFKSTLGASADIEAVLDERKNVLSLPVDCVVDNHVFIFKDGIAEAKQVMLGFTDGYYIEIISGLDEGETVILCPENISDGDKVEIA